MGHPSPATRTERMRPAILEGASVVMLLVAAARDRLRQVDLMFRQLPGATWTTDHDLRITNFLGRVEHRLGVPLKRIIGMTVQDFTRSREPTDPVVSCHLAALRGESSSCRYNLRDDWYEVHVEPLCDESGRITGCIAAAVDVTERKAEEERARAKEAHLVEIKEHTISLLEATIESTADGILVVDRTGCVVAHNERFVALWRIPGELVEQGDDEALLTYAARQLRDPDEFMRGVQDLYDRPEAESLDVLRFSDGRVFERYSRPQRVGGEIVGRVWSFRDVTERERVLRHAFVLSDASRLLTTLDAEKALEGVAQLVVPLLGEACAIDLVFDRMPRRLVEVPDGATVTWPTGATSRILSGHSWVRQREAGSRIIAPMSALGRVVGAISVISTARRAYRPDEVELLEEVARRSAIALENSRLYRTAKDQIRAREEFVAVASHEIRGPIASIRLAVQAIRDALAPTQKLIDVIDGEERRLARLVDELLDLGRLESGQLHLALARVDLAEVVDAIVTRLSTQIDKSGSALTIDRADGVVGEWDRARLDQVVANLLSNAIKFGLGRPIEITMGVSDGSAVLTITDHGIGIPADMRNAIFEPFERAVPARHYGGLGLGLYIAWSIVTALGGTIDVRSTPGEGSSFAVKLPLEPDP